MSDRVELHEKVKELTDAMVLRRGHLEIFPTAISDMKKVLEKASVDEKKAIAHDLIAVITRFMQEANEGAAPALADLLLLAETALRDVPPSSSS